MAETTNRSMLTAVSGWPLSRKISFIAVLLLCAAVFAVIIFQGRVADHRLLFANLSETDASAVITWLKDQKIPYQIKDGGKAIHVPADKVYESRLALAGIGIPQGGGIGFEIFDKQSFGVTDFTQKVNYQRALQGELARTIASLGPVESARVMLAIPEKRLFKEQQKETTASVIVKLAPGQRMNDNQVQGVVHLVSGSIEGLAPENVTVIDSGGNILTRSAGREMNGPMTPGMLEYQQSLEQTLAGRAQSLLDRALGSGNSLARVTAKLDFAQVEKTEEFFDPTNTVPRSEQVLEEKSGSESSAGGIPGAASNLQEGQALAGSGNSSSRTTETINYEISKTISRVVAPVGAIQNLSVAVLVADRFTAAAEGEEGGTFTPRPDKELKSIEEMVGSALGLDNTRGDQIKVVSMPFETDLYSQVVTDQPEQKSFYEYLPYVKYGIIILASGLFYLLLVRPLMKTVVGGGSRPQRFLTVEELESDLAGHEQLPAPSDPLSKVRQRILKSETSPTQVIRSWMNQE